MTTLQKGYAKLRKLSFFEIVFYSGLVLLPLIYYPGVKLIPHEISRVFFVNRWVELLTIITLFNIKKIPKKDKNISIQILLIMFVAIILITSFLGVDPFKSFIGNYYRNDGIFTLIHLVTLALIVSLMWKNSSIKNTARSISLGSLVVSLLFLLQLRDVFNPPGVTFGNPIFLAGYLSVTLPFTALLIKEKLNLIFWIGVLIIQSAVVILTFSYGGIIAFVVFLLGFIFLSSIKLRYKLISLAGSLLLVSLIISTYLKNLIITQEKLIYLPDSRERIFRKALMAISERPLLGWGWANFDYAFEAYTWPVPVKNDIYIDKAHSSFVEVIATAGVLGLITYLAIIIKSAINLYKSKEKLLRFFLLALVLIIIHSQTNVISIAEEVILMMIIGVAAKS